MLDIFYFRFQRGDRGTTLIVSKRDVDKNCNISKINLQRELQFSLPDYMKQNGNFIWLHEINKLPNLSQLNNPDVSILTGIRKLQRNCINVHPILRGGLCLITVTFSSVFNRISKDER